MGMPEEASGEAPAAGGAGVPEAAGAPGADPPRMAAGRSPRSSSVMPAIIWTRHGHGSLPWVAARGRAGRPVGALPARRPGRRWVPIPQEVEESEATSTISCGYPLDKRRWTIYLGGWNKGLACPGQTARRHVDREAATARQPWPPGAGSARVSGAGFGPGVLSM